MRRRIVAMLVSALLMPAAGAYGARPAPQRLTVEILATIPHDPGAFTEGLEFANGRLYESTGLVGESTLTAGPPGGPAEVRVALPPPLFGEGISVLGATMWQLTWTNGVAIERDSQTLAELRRVHFTGQGWGLCHQADGRLVMSDGSSRLTFRDPRTFAVIGSVEVGRGPLNELECVGDDVYANLYRTKTILRIDSRSGRVTGVVNADALQGGRDAEVLNGIAAIPATDQFLLTGKRWATTYRVRFVPAA